MHEIAAGSSQFKISTATAPYHLPLLWKSMVSVGGGGGERKGQQSLGREGMDRGDEYHTNTVWFAETQFYQTQLEILYGLLN